MQYRNDGLSFLLGFHYSYSIFAPHFKKNILNTAGSYELETIFQHIYR